jgi:hypothetical protein
MPAITTIPAGPGPLDRMVQATLVVGAKYAPLSISLKRITSLVHGSPLLKLAASLNAVFLSSANPLFFIWLCVVDACSKRCTRIREAGIKPDKLFYLRLDQ